MSSGSAIKLVLNNSPLPGSAEWELTSASGRLQGNLRQSYQLIFRLEDGDGNVFSTKQWIRAGVAKLVVELTGETELTSGANSMGVVKPAISMETASGAELTRGTGRYPEKHLADDAPQSPKQPKTPRSIPDPPEFIDTNVGKTDYSAIRSSTVAETATNKPHTEQGR